MTLQTTIDRVPPAPPARPGALRGLLRQLGRVTENAPALVGLTIVVFWVLVALRAPLVAPYPPNANNMAALAYPYPSAQHWLGTDHLGRDILSRIVWGARTVLLVAPIAVLGAAAIGSLLGLMAGYYRGWIDDLISRVGDIVLSFPVIILYMIILAVSGCPFSCSTQFT